LIVLISAPMLGLVLVACGGGAEQPQAATTTEASPTTTTASTLPLVPTTSTTSIDPGVDPPVPVVDPGPPPGRNSVYVLGDSVLIGAASTIPVRLPDWVVTYDAESSRRLAQAIDVLSARRHEIGEAVVVQLGNNYIDGERGDYASQIDETMAVLSGVPRVVWVTVAEVSPSRVAINEAIRTAGERHPNVHVADWAEAMAADPALTWDAIHLTPQGRERMAELVARGLGPVDP
jgi:hypothetical protein